MFMSSELLRKMKETPEGVSSEWSEKKKHLGEVGINL
jgi:hypothetical protein